MEDEKKIRIILEGVLGKGVPKSRGNAAFDCPFCHHHKPKLEIQLRTNENKENPWHCWVCEKRGKTLSSLFNQLNISEQKIKELAFVIQPGRKIEKEVHSIFLPKEFLPLSDLSSLDKVQSIEARHALKYLKNRRITDLHALKYNLGVCVEGEYAHRIIIPSYDSKGKLNYFISRSYREDEPQKYKNPPVDKNIIGWEYYINWNTPIILVEGMFDALTIQRNVIPLFGKIISEELMKKIVGSQVNKIYIALDSDAIKSALKHCEMLMSFGKEVYLIEIDGKDASSIGFEHFLEIIENTEPLTFNKLLKIKLNK